MEKIADLISLVLNTRTEHVNALIALSAIFLAGFAIFVVWSVAT